MHRNVSLTQVLRKTRSEITDGDYTDPNISAAEDVKAFIGNPIKCLRIRVRLVLSSHEMEVSL
jgi:hypothetical protein